MSTPSSPYRYFSDIYTAVVKDAKESTSAQIVSLVQRWINEGQERIHRGKKRDWLDQTFTVQLNPAVQASCTVTNGSNIVAFASGTTFPSGIELQFWNQGFPEVYNVISSSLNVVRLDQPFLGTTSTSALGVVYQSSVALDATIREVYKVYHQHNSQPLTPVSPQQFRDLQEMQSPNTDYSVYYSIFGQVGSSRRLVLYPYPLTAYTLNIDAQITPSVLVNATDESVIPIQFRQALYWYALYKLWKYHRNRQMAVDAYNEYRDCLNQINAETKVENDAPQIVVAYPRGRTLKMFTPPFNPNWRT